MGAQTFWQVASGKNASDAFNNAVREAQYEYGHRGYTGTIAEKFSFVMIQKKPMAREDAMTTVDELIAKQDQRIDDKWGPAGCIPLEDGSYLFFGWASS